MRRILPSECHLKLSRLILLFAGWLGLLSMQPPGMATAQENLASSSGQIEMGFGGIVKLGKWIPIFIEVEPALEPTRFEITAIDGDETPVVYAGQLLTDPDKSNRYQAWARFGRILGNTELRLFNEAGKQVSLFRLPFQGENRIASFHDSTRELVLAVEPGTHLANAITSTSAFGSDGESRIAISLGPEDGLPFNWLGYDEVKSVLVTTSNLERVRQISKTQVEALEVWVKNGGTLILSVAENSETLLANGGILERFRPGIPDGTHQLTQSKRLETFAESREQLIPIRGEPIATSKFREIRGRIVVSDNAENALVIRRAYGLGKIVFVTFDLDSDRLMQWKSFPNLLSKLVSENQQNVAEQDSQQTNKGNSVTHYGFKDLVGQLRVPLDQFTNVRFVNFAWVALLIAVYILCIGPGDYFFLRKLTGRMELTWITFPLISLLFCGLAIGISQMTRPDTVQLNQLEIVDIDVADGRVRGSVWTNLYSPSGESCSVELDSVHEMGFSIDADIITWHGLPGDGLGGMKTRINPGLLTSEYEQRSVLSDNGQDWHSSLEELPLRVSSTRSLFGQWWSDEQIPVQSGLEYDSRTKRFSNTSTITNPFDFTLNNCRLVFEDWAYVFDQPLGPGQTVHIQTETTEKSLKHLLTRRTRETEKSDRSINSPWDKTDTRVNRIADMMMFYQAAGGNNYTGLTHDYQPFTDLTDHLGLQRAILIGEVDSVGSVLRINGKRMSENYDQTVTIVRVVLPIKYRNDARRSR